MDKKLDELRAAWFSSPKRLKGQILKTIVPDSRKDEDYRFKIVERLASPKTLIGLKSSFRDLTDPMTYEETLNYIK